MKTPFEIIDRPIITEKTTAGQAMANPQYTFKVRPDSNKIEFKAAIETAFPGVKVRHINVITMTGKVRRMRQRVGKRPNWKKMIVTLEKGNTIELY